MASNPDNLPTLYASYPFPTYSSIDLAAMTEITFAKQFLQALDARPVKIPADYVQDPKTYYPRNAYTLPRLVNSMSKRKPTSSAPGSERSLTVSIKSLRNPPLDIKLSSQSLNTSVLDLKTAVSEQTSIPVEKMKLLFNKKPVVDSKVLKDLTGEGETAAEFSVMVMGGANVVVKKAKEPEVAQGPSGAEVLETAEFWNDLKGFLLQRIRDEKQAGELFDTFQTAWKAK